MSERIVCITGAAGFIGSHLVREFLERGFRVRATVRDREARVKNAHLLKLPGAEQRLELFSADLEKLGSFREALDGAEWLVHAAAAVRLAAKRPQEEIIDPTVEGTANLIATIKANQSVKRIALISSVAAVLSTEQQKGHVFTEDDWCSDATVATNPYGLAKTQSERMLTEYCSHRDAPFLTVVNPAVVIGPLLSRLHTSSSLSIIRDLYTNSFGGCPQLGIGVIDVRDVATAVFEALEQMKGGRFILANGSYWLQEVAGSIKESFPDAPTSLRKLPNFFLYVAAIFSARLNFAYIRKNLGYKPEFSNERARAELGLTLRPMPESVADTCRSLIAMRALGKRA